MSLCVRHWKLLPVAMILYGCVSMPSPASSVPVTESTVNEKIDQLVGQLTQETSLFTGKMFAVTEFTDASDKKTALTAYLTDLLIDRLSKSGKIHLVERSRLDTVMNELDFSMTGYIEDRSEKLLGRIIGADGIVTGKVIDLGDTLDVKVRLIQTETGKIIATAQVELVNDRKMQRLAGQAYEKPKTDTKDKIQGLDQLRQASELVAKEDWQGLQKLAETWTASEPGNSLSWFNLGLAYGKLKQYDKAIAAYQEAVRIDPDDARAWNNLGVFYKELKQYDKAIAAYQEAARIGPDNADTWILLGFIYHYDLKQYDKAVTAYQEVLRIEPNDFLAWYGLGDTYAHLNQYDKAVTASQEAVRLKPDLAEAWRLLSLIYFSQGRYGKTYKAYQILRKLDGLMADEFSNVMFKERWLRYSVSPADGSVNFIDYKSITPVSESIVRVWTKTDFDKNDKAFLKMREALREKGSLEYTMDHREINCVESKFRLLSIVMYGKEGALDQHDSDDLPWNIILPDSVGERFKNAMCD